MADPRDRYTLRPPQSSDDWSAYHAIRRGAIFAPLLPRHTYDEHDPDEFKPGHLPHLLVRDGEIVGTVRIDLIDADQAGLRLIGIRNDLQRQGHGAILLQLAEKAAHAFGRTMAFLKRAVAMSSIVRVILRILRMDLRRLSRARALAMYTSSAPG